MKKAIARIAGRLAACLLTHAFFVDPPADSRLFSSKEKSAANDEEEWPLNGDFAITNQPKIFRGRSNSETPPRHGVRVRSTFFIGSSVHLASSPLQPGPQRTVTQISRGSPVRRSCVPSLEMESNQQKVSPAPECAVPVA